MTTRRKPQWHELVTKWLRYGVVRTAGGIFVVDPRRRKAQLEQIERHRACDTRPVQFTENEWNREQILIDAVRDPVDWIRFAYGVALGIASVWRSRANRIEPRPDVIVTVVNECRRLDVLHRGRWTAGLYILPTIRMWSAPAAGEPDRLAELYRIADAGMERCVVLPEGKVVSLEEAVDLAQNTVLPLDEESD